MKILSVLPAPASPSGLIFARRQIASLEKLGIANQTVLIPSKNLNLRKTFRSYRELSRQVRSFRPDIVHVHYGILYSLLAAYSSLRPLVITFQGSDINTVKSKSFIRNFYSQFLSNLAALRAGTIICVSRNLVKNLWWGKKKVVIIPPGINLEEFREIDRAEARRKLGWNEEGKVVLFNANNPSVKRLDIAMKTLDLLKDKIPGVRLEILDGSLPNDALIPVMLNASDALLICSDSEGSPTMVKEALACNCPVVGVDVGDVAERLAGTRMNALVEKDPAALAEALRAVLTSGKRSDGRAKLISDGLSEEETAAKIYSVYKQLAGKA